ncbi:UDP-glucuronic acid decarboxylase family protein [[Pseudomonas] boreopolis]|uniref:UDP-glucuronic acid decarboxylase family protein n=1 Tax=Xanthomonas boreopolis TaxID=86183 RepID=UPI0032DCDC95
MDGVARSKQLKRKHALVAGGAGFIGAHLCRRLLAEGFRVTVLDSLVTGRLGNLGDLVDHDAVRFVRHDVTKPYDDPTADVIFNLACCASPVHYQARPVHTLQTCLEGSLNLLELAKRNGARIFQASTSEVYGEPETHPQQEGYRGAVNSIGPRACYDEGKRCAETLFFDYHRLYGVDIKVARIFNTYGPYMREDDGRVVSNLIVQAIRGEPMTLHGDGSQTRSFCYVDDLVEGIVRLMGAPEAFTGPVNLGNPEEITVLELAERIRAMTGSASPLRRLPMPIDDPTRRCPDIALARRQLDWEPRVPLEQGLRRTIEWFRSQEQPQRARLHPAHMPVMEVHRGCA